MKARLWKILRWTLLVLAVLIVAAGLVFYVLVRRAWPELDGRLAAPGLQAPVEIVRVEPGVPHIYAKNAHDLFFAQGYVHAQDRLWQMEFNRIVGQGRLASLFGEGALEIDRIMHVLGLAKAAERDWQVLSPDTRAALTAYADGVNAYLSTHRGRLPIEFTVLGVEPQPWKPVDSLTWGKMMALNLSQNHPFEILRAHLIAKLGEPVARRLMSPYPSTGPVIVPPGAHGFAGFPTPRAERTRLALLPGLSMISGIGQAWGSNGWVVAGSRTASGRPLLANDTHLGLQLPSVWYQIGLHGGGYDEAGFSFPGMPFVEIGHNRRIAWGITNLCGDVQDLYIEKLDDAKHPRRYQYQGQWRDLVLRREEIAVKGKPAVVLEVPETLHGPIINDAISELKGSPPTALRWPAFGGTRLVDALAALNRAEDWKSFHQALEAWETPSVNFVYADMDGHIAYQSTGRIPIRAAGHQGLVPVPGWDGRSEWQGFIPYEEMPKSVDPPSGFIVTANNKVVGDDYPYFIAYDMADPYRAQRITDLLAAGHKFTLAGLRAIQAETAGLPVAAMRPYLLAVKPAERPGDEGARRGPPLGPPLRDRVRRRLRLRGLVLVLPQGDPGRRARARGDHRVPHHRPQPGAVDHRADEAARRSAVRRPPDPRRRAPRRHRPPEPHQGRGLALQALRRRPRGLDLRQGPLGHLRPRPPGAERHRPAGEAVQQPDPAGPGERLHGGRRDPRLHQPVRGGLRHLAADDRRLLRPGGLDLGQQHRPERPALEPPPRGPDPEVGGGRGLPDAIRRGRRARPSREPPDPRAGTREVSDEMTDGAQRESLCRAVGELGAQGWCQGTGGNFSLTLSHDPMRLLITRSGVDKRHLTPADLMLVGEDAGPVPEETGRPSAETALHCRIVAATGAASVLHVHSVANTLLSEHFAPQGGFTLQGYEMLKGLRGVTTHEASVFVPVFANSQDIPRLSGEVAELLGKHPDLRGFLLAGHGLYAWGESLAEAKRHVEILEFLFECAARRTSFRPFTG